MIYIIIPILDEKKLAFTPAVEISFIRPKNQRYIAVSIEGQQSSPSLSQAQKMRELDKDGKLNGDVIDGILSQEKKEVDNALISNTKGEGKEGDPFWTKAETLLYCALLGYIIFEGAEEDRNLNTLVDMISGMEVKEDDEDFLNAVDYMFKGLEQRKPNCFAVKQYKKYKLSSGKTAKSILISCGSRLAPFDIPQLREIMSYDELELDRMGDRRTANTI